jgi:hypothetical protein
VAWQNRNVPRKIGRDEQRDLSRAPRIHHFMNMDGNIAVHKSRLNIAKQHSLMGKVYLALLT